MSRMQGPVLGACLLGALLLGCSRSDPAPRDFTVIDTRPTAENPAQALAAAEAACKEETRRRGIASVSAIFLRFRRGKVDEDYIQCMKARGYEAGQ